MSENQNSLSQEKQNEILSEYDAQEHKEVLLECRRKIMQGIKDNGRWDK